MFNESLLSFFFDADLSHDFSHDYLEHCKARLNVFQLNHKDASGEHLALCHIVQYILHEACLSNASQAHDISDSLVDIVVSQVLKKVRDIPLSKLYTLALGRNVFDSIVF